MMFVWIWNYRAIVRENAMLREENNRLRQDNIKLCQDSAAMLTEYITLREEHAKRYHIYPSDRTDNVVHLKRAEL